MVLMWLACFGGGLGCFHGPARTFLWFQSDTICYLYCPSLLSLYGLDPFNQTKTKHPSARLSRCVDYSDDPRV